MLQFVTKYPAERSIVEQVKGVIDGGCRWIEVSAPGLDEASLAAIVDEIIPVCKEVDAFVVMRDHTHLAAQKRLHGLLMDYSGDPRKVREELGGEAIIGVKVHSIDHLANLRAADIDYFVVDLHDAAERDHAIGMVVEARKRDMKMPIVAEGEFSIEDMQALLQAGFSGIALSSSLADAPSPAEATAYVMRALLG